MPIDLSKEQTILLSEVPFQVPTRRGKKVHYSTVYRWAMKGASGRKLETVLSGGIRYTTVEAVQRFLFAKPSMPQSHPQDMSDAIEAALREAGV